MGNYCTAKIKVFSNKTESSSFLLQEALDRAGPGDTVVLEPGSVRKGEAIDVFIVHFPETALRSTVLIWTYLGLAVPILVVVYKWDKWRTYPILKYPQRRRCKPFIVSAR